MRWIIQTGLAIAFIFSISSHPAKAIVMTDGCAAVDSECTLAELFGGGSFIADDKLFHSFFPIEDSLGDLDTLVLAPFSASFDPDPLDPGPGFIVDWSTLATPTAHGDPEAVSHFEFIVDVLTPGLFLGDMSLEFETTPSCMTSGDDTNECLSLIDNFGPGGAFVFHEFFDDGFGPPIISEMLSDTYPSTPSGLFEPCALPAAVIPQLTAPTVLSPKV